MSFHFDGDTCWASGFELADASQCIIIIYVLFVPSLHSIKPRYSLHCIDRKADYPFRLASAVKEVSMLKLSTETFPP